MSDEIKAREFWIAHLRQQEPDDTGFRGNKGVAIDWPWPTYQEQIHVIEHSRVAELEAELAKLKSTLPGCMMPDGADPCDTFKMRDQLVKERDLLQLEVARLIGEKSAIAGKHMKDLPEYNELLAQATAMAETLDWRKELSGLDRPTDFAEAQAKGRAISGALELWSKFLSERGGVGE